MGAKQSKRSVDISGKEAEGAGEVAVAGAGGEGRVEQLADADALKPQVNGDAQHIHEQTEKIKDLDSGTPENEKDATTEKEEKQQDDEKEAAPLTNGESEQKIENGESTPTPEDGKKPKKEKVKKKWSLRSISFSRKDKPKQEKKQKDEEPKTNGEPEKVPEETAEVAPESAVTETAEEAKTDTEIKEENTPETPVTEPITNGTTTPESPKVESLAAEESAAPSPDHDRPVPQSEIQPEQLPVNGLSLEEPAKEIPEQNEESKEESTAETTEIVPEISVIKEVCVEQMPLIDSTPPPLPANPPPSSVASFAATTMAPESTDASLANTADNVIPPPPSDLIAKDTLGEIPPKPENELTTIQTELSCPIKEVCEEPSVSIAQTEVENATKETLESVNLPACEPAKVENVETDNDAIDVSLAADKESKEEEISENFEMEIPAPPSGISEKINEMEVLPLPAEISQHSELEIITPPSDVIELQEDKTDLPNEDLPSPPSPICDDVDDASTEKNLVEENFDSTLAPIHDTNKILVNSNHISDDEETSALEKENANDKEVKQKTSIKSKDSLCNLIETIECNGNIVEENLPTEKETTEVLPSTIKEISNVESGRTVTTPDDSMPPSLSEANESAPAAGVASTDASESFPLPPSELCRSDSASPPASPEPPALTPQDPPVNEKLAHLIPEVPDVPELKTETLQETTSDVAVAN